MNKTVRKYCWLLIAACFFVYTSTICIKMVYSSEIVEIINKFGETKARVGLGLTAYYFTYAAAQLGLAPFVKKINMGKLMVCTLTLSAILYGIIPFTTELYQLWLILALNGILQSSAWGGCMYFFGKYLPPDMNGPACSIMSVGFIGGTIVSYVIAPIFVANGIWQYAFLLFAVMLFVSVIVFIFVERKVEKVFLQFVPEENKTETPKNISENHQMQSDGKVHLAIVVISFMAVASLVVHVAYYVISSWFPVYLSDIFKMDSTYSILVTVVLYVCSFICTNLGFMLCEKWKKTFSDVSRVFSAAALVLSVIQAVTYRSYLLLAIALSTLVISFTRATGTLMASYLPLKLKGSVNAATTAMVLNAAASLGAAIGPSAAGSIIDNYGWTVYFIFICAVYVVGFSSVMLSTHFCKKLNV